MGTHTYSDIVDFVAHSVLCGESSDEFYSNDNLNRLKLITQPMIMNEDEDKVKPADVDKYYYQGWNLFLKKLNKNYQIDLVACGKRNKISGYKFQKDEHTVFVVNESEYESVGYFELAVVSDKKESIELFLKDFDLGNNEIDENDTCQQTW